MKVRWAGPSAGALMAALIIAALENFTLPQDVTMSGTISSDGHIGEIGGVIEKAKAAKEDNKRILILPRENSQLVRYKEVRISEYTWNMLIHLRML